MSVYFQEMKTRKETIDAYLLAFEMKYKPTERGLRQNVINWRQIADRAGTIVEISYAEGKARIIEQRIKDLIDTGLFKRT